MVVEEKGGVEGGEVVMESSLGREWKRLSWVGEKVKVVLFYITFAQIDSKKIRKY